MPVTDEFKAAAIEADRNLSASDEADQPQPTGLSPAAALAWAAAQGPGPVAAPTPTPTPTPKEPELSKEEFRAAAKDAYEKTRTPLQAIEDFPLNRLTGYSTALEAGATFTKRVGEDIAALAAAPAQAGAGLIAAQGTEAPNLQGLSIDQVKQTRTQMQQALTALDKQKDDLINSGETDERQLYLYSQRTNSLTQRIREADDIIKSGVRATAPSPVSEPVGNALAAYGRWQPSATKQALDQALPTNEDFQNTLFGQIATGGADALSMIAGSVLLPVAGGPAVGGAIFANQSYQDAKAAGASDQTAEIASGLTLLTSPAAFAVTGQVAGYLAKGLAGLTAKEGINRIVQATPALIRAVTPGAEMTTFQFQQNLIARLSGYDPNRPLTENFWQSFLVGEAWGAGTHLISQVPRLSGMAQPSTRVREKDTTQPPPPTPKTEAPPQPVPTTTAQTTVTPEHDATDADTKLSNLANEIKGTAEKPSFTLGAGTEPVYTGPTRPQPVEQKAVQLSLTAPSTTTLEKQGETPTAREPTADQRFYDLETRRARGEISREDYLREVRQLQSEQAREAQRETPTTPTAPTAAAPEAPKGTPIAAPAEGDIQNARGQIQRAQEAGEISDLVANGLRATATNDPELALRRLQEYRGTAPAPAKEGLTIRYDEPNKSWYVERKGQPEARFSSEQQARDYIAGEAAVPRRTIEEAKVPAAVDRDAVLKQVVNELPEASRRMYDRGDKAMVYAVNDEVEYRLADARKAAAPEAVPASELPPGTAPKKRTGYMVHWVDDSRPEHDMSRYQQRSFRRGKDAQAFVRSLKGGPNIQIRMEDLFHPPAWYDQEQPPASRAPVSAELPPDRPVGLAEVKSEVNTAQDHMGMEDNLVYVAHAEDLPEHVKAGMTDAQRNATAQIVTDRKLGKVYVIGDRFDSLNDLRQKIIEETLPYRYRNATRLNTVHDATDNRLGFYDLIGDRPVINTHALLRAPEPYREAMKTSMEEVNVHQGISRLLGLKEGPRYIAAMKDIQAQFNRMGLNDILAQKKGYADAEAMAADYGIPDWKTDPKQANKMTEELIGAYSRTFRTPEELTANAPAWYQSSLRNIANGIRNFLGLRVDPYDVQSLLNDSAAALRQPKWREPAAYHPVGDQAKTDMQAFQYANKAPPPAPGEKVAGPEEKADIGTELVKARAAALERGLQPGEFIRQQALRIAFDKSRNLDTRLNELRRSVAVDITDDNGHEALMYAANRIYDENFGGDPHQALDYLIGNESKWKGNLNTAVTEVVSRKAQEEINALRSSGNENEANIMQARLDRMEQLYAPVATESGRTLEAQKMRSETGSSLVGDTVANTQKDQQDEISKGKNSGNKKKIDAAEKSLAERIKEGAQSLMNKKGVKDVADAVTEKFRWSTTKPLPEQFSEDLVNRIKDALFKMGVPREPGPLEQVYDTFRRNIQQLIRERLEPIQPSGKAEPPSATDTLRTIIQNYPYYHEAWGRTVDMLRELGDPDMIEKFDKVLDEPIGEQLANRLAMESGQNLRELIYNHFSTADRISQDLALKIVYATGLDGPTARRMAYHLQDMFREIIDKEQRAKLAEIVRSVDGPGKPARSELDRLVDHIAIGSLDSSEWLNVVAPRFNIKNYTPAQIDGLRAAGDFMQYLRDNALSNSPIAQKVRTTIGELLQEIELSDLPDVSRGLVKSVRYSSDMYTAGLINSAITHLPYFQQTGFLQAFDGLIQGLRAARRSGDPHAVTGMVVPGFLGFARALRETLPILRGEYRPEPEATFRATEPEAMIRSPLERGQITPDPRTWLNSLKIVHRLLDTTSNLFMRGSQYAVWYANAFDRATRDGIRGSDAAAYAEKAVIGTPDQRDLAESESKRIADEVSTMFPKQQFNEQMRQLLEDYLLDQYKTKLTDKADSSLSDDVTQERRDVARRAIATSLGASMRGDPRGIWGRVSRAALQVMGEEPQFRFVMPFAKVPFNLVNEFAAWGPAGIWHSTADLVPPDSLFGKLVAQVPGMRGGVRTYLELANDPRVEKMLKSGEISPAQMRDIAVNHMIKGVIGTMGYMALGAAVKSMLSNLNPPVRFTYLGPSSYGQQQIEKGKGWQARSVYLDPAFFGPAGGWHSYENTPWRPLLASLGSYEDYHRYDQKDPNDPNAAMFATWHAITGWMTSMFGSPLQGPDTMLQVLTNANNSGVQRAAMDFASQALSATVMTPLAATPFGGTMGKQLYRLFDPQEYEGDGWAKTLRYIPVVNHMLLRPKINVFGEPMTSTPLHNIPEYGSKLPDDPVWNYLATHPHIVLTMPGNSATVGHIKMTPDEVYQYHLARGPYLKQELARAFSDPAFEALPTIRQNEIIKKVYEHAANMAGAAKVFEYREEHPVTPERIERALEQRGLVPEVETAGVPTTAETE